MISPIVFLAFVIILSAAVIIARGWQDWETSQRIYAIAAAGVMLIPLVVVPYHIPTTGRTVYWFSWDPPTYPDPLMEAVFTPEAVEQLRTEANLPLAEDVIQRSIHRRASVRGPQRRWTFAVFGLIVLAGWYIVPPLIDRVLLAASPDERGERA